VTNKLETCQVFNNSILMNSLTLIQEFRKIGVYGNLTGFMPLDHSTSSAHDTIILHLHFRDPTVVFISFPGSQRYSEVMT
jgi:hypothetical protein